MIAISGRFPGAYEQTFVANRPSVSTWANETTALVSHSLRGNNNESVTDNQGDAGDYPAPVISADGQTYTFTIRGGLWFSPPYENEAVTAQTFKASIERALSPAMQSPAQNFGRDIVGVTVHLASCPSPRLGGEKPAIAQVGQ